MIKIQVQSCKRIFYNFVYFFWGVEKCHSFGQKFVVLIVSLLCLLSLSLLFPIKLQFNSSDSSVYPIYSHIFPYLPIEKRQFLEVHQVYI